MRKEKVIQHSKDKENMQILRRKDKSDCLRQGSGNNVITGGHSPTLTIDHQ